MNKISIIIPVYNTERYLRQCLNSIICQTYQEFEVIIVNDGSTDNSMDICDEYARMDSRFRCYTKENGGVSAARNYALMKAESEWITFVDSDDWIEPNYLDTLISYAKENVDIVMGNLYFNKTDSQSFGKCSFDIIEKKNMPHFPMALLVSESLKADNLYADVEILCAACSKLTRKSLIDNNKIQFQEDLKLNEDGLFHLNCYALARNVIISSTPIYHYRCLETSSNRRFREDVFEQMKLWKKYFYNASSFLLEHDRKLFISLSNYRRYSNLYLLYFGKKECKLFLHQKLSLLKKVLEEDEYTIFSIPKELPLFKKLEMFLLEHKLILILFLFTKLKYDFKRMLG